MISHGSFWNKSFMHLELARWYLCLENIETHAKTIQPKLSELRNARDLWCTDYSTLFDIEKKMKWRWYLIIWMYLVGRSSFVTFEPSASPLFPHTTCHGTVQRKQPGYLQRLALRHMAKRFSLQNPCSNWFWESQNYSTSICSKHPLITTEIASNYIKLMMVTFYHSLTPKQLVLEAILVEHPQHWLAWASRKTYMT